MNALLIQRGDRSDYAHLAPVHYRRVEPAVIDRVYRAVRASDPDEAIGVLVVSYPALSCVARTSALGDRYAGLSRAEKAEHVNAEVRTISRLIVDPRHRGRGLGRMLIRAALGDAATRFVEAITSMGHLHPVFERAGMRRVASSLSRDDRRLSTRLSSLDVDDAVLSDVESCVDRVRSVHGGAGVDALRRTLLSWKRASPRSFRGTATDWERTLSSDDGLVSVLQEASARLLYPPCYYLHDREAPLVPSRAARSGEVIHVEVD